MLADLGCADLKWHDERIQWKQRPTDVSVHICTIQYRPPDMLLGSLHFGPDLDLWPLGCVAAELFLREPLFHPKRASGNVERHVFVIHLEILGDAPEGLQHVRVDAIIAALREVLQRAPSNLSLPVAPTRLRGCQAQLVDFVRKTVQWLPQERLTAASASQHEFLSSRALSVIVSLAQGKKKGAKLHCRRQPR